MLKPYNIHTILQRFLFIILINRFSLLSYFTLIIIFIYNAFKYFYKFNINLYIILILI